MDEKGVLMGLLKNIGVICKKTSTPTNLIHSGDRELASIIECIFAIGHALPPLIIFKGKWQMKAWHDALPKGVNGKAIGQIATSESGWTNNAIGYEWITKFDVQSKKHQQGKYRLLLVDGHEFHITIKVVQFCLEKKIVLTKMPPHLMHLLQPLDFGVFGPLAMYYRNSLQNLSYSYFNVDKVDFIEIYFAARAKAMSEFNILHAWRDCGYFPFDPEIPCKSILAKKTRPQTPPDQQSQALHSSIDIPYHKHQINHFIWKAVLQGNLSRADVFKLAKAATVNKAKATVKDIQCNKLIESKAREARKSTRRKGNWGDAMVLDQAAIDCKMEKEVEKEWLVQWRQFACPISQAQQIFKVTKQKKKVRIDLSTEDHNQAVTLMTLRYRLTSVAKTPVNTSLPIRTSAQTPRSVLMRPMPKTRNTKAKPVKVSAVQEVE